MLTRDQIVGTNDIEKRTVQVPEWGGEVLVRVMNGKQRDRFERHIADAKRKDGTFELVGTRALLVSLTLCDETGALLFGPENVAELENKNSIALQRIFDVAAEINELGATAIEKAKEDFLSGQN